MKNKNIQMGYSDTQGFYRCYFALAALARTIGDEMDPNKGFLGDAPADTRDVAPDIQCKLEEIGDLLLSVTDSPLLETESARQTARVRMKENLRACFKAMNVPERTRCNETLPT